MKNNYIEILVECVAKHSPIYNPEKRDYKDLNIQDISGKQNIIYIVCNN